VTTLPSFFKAANVSIVEHNEMTFDKLEPTFSGKRESVLPPPRWLSPHAITLPLLFKAANAYPVEYTATTPEDILFAGGIGVP
jgi:hypothetical protein